MTAPVVTAQTIFTGKGSTTIDVSSYDVNFKTSTDSAGDLIVDIDYTLKMANTLVNGDTAEMFACFQWDTSEWKCALSQLLSYDGTLFSVRNNVYTMRRMPTVLDFTDHASYASAFPSLTGVAQYYGSDSKATVKGKDAQYKLYNIYGNSASWSWQTKGNTLSSDGKTFKTAFKYKDSKKQQPSAQMYENLMQSQMFHVYQGVYTKLSASTENKRAFASMTMKQTSTTTKSGALSLVSTVASCICLASLLSF